MNLISFMFILFAQISVNFILRMEERNGSIFTPVYQQFFVSTYLLLGIWKLLDPSEEYFQFLGSAH